MKRFGQTQFARTLARAAFGLALVLLLWPATSSAAVGRCMEVSVSDMAERGMTTLMFSNVDESTLVSDTSETLESAQQQDLGAELSEPQEDEVPCASDPDADPSSNFCFEDAEGQISTLPRLLAQWRGEQAASTVVNSMLAAIGSVDDEAPVESADEMLAASIDIEPEAPDEDSCTSNPDECRSLPPLPPTLTVDVSAPAARQVLYQIDVPSSSSEDTIQAWADLRVGPQFGYHSLPDKPPRG